MLNNLTIRPASQVEFETAIQWAANEGWNPGTDDLSAFYLSDPKGFIMGFAGDIPVSSISVVRYGKGYGFLGFYIVHPDYRGQRIGLATWNAGLDHLKGRCVGLDGVVDQQENYIKSGFQLFDRNIRYTGVPQLTAGDNSNMHIENVTRDHVPVLLPYDRAFFARSRDAFLQEWLLPAAAGVKSRKAKVALVDKNIVGYGVIRGCRKGYKIGPLFGENDEIASFLFDALCREVPAGEEVSLDTPEKNPGAVSLAVRAGLIPVFETARMYRGDIPNLSTQRTYGITTFELG